MENQMTKTKLTIEWTRYGDYEDDFVSFIRECILQSRIDPEEVPQLMDRVYSEELHLSP